MNQLELPKTYDPSEVESDINRGWEESGYFNPDTLPTKRGAKVFSMALPPPNATGVLHIGHAVMLAIQDILARYHRMRGEKVLWLPGTDHAAIATQNVVEKQLKAEGKTKEDMGREAFRRRVETFVEHSQGTIREQIKSMGASLDWSRERFTLDEGLSEAVKTAFITMYNDGLIYRGNRIVNWCPRCQSTLADDEVEYREEKAPFYYFKYGPVIIGTARPETKFGDKVIIVHPDDKRYQNIIGQEFDVEWILGPIKAKVIADPSADPELGSGAMTITPGHSFVDFDLAKKYDIPVEKIIDEQGTLTAAAGEYAGLPVREARKKVVEVLKEKGLLERIDEEYKHNLSVCYRCGTPVEPLPSRQWFVAVDKATKRLNGKTLKQRALAVVEKHEIAFIPDRFEKVYQRWMENLHDWCISRQLWYGHRIPVWYCEDCHDDPEKFQKGEYYWIVAKDTPAQCPRCDSKNIHQDHDTLDTWFSSGLWTFSTLGWPEKTKDLKTFHPTTVLETAYDIILFWVARMILMSTYLLKEIPFETVYFHGLVRDEQGRKMSKSLNNGIDPMVMARKYGADAVRLSMIIGKTPGNDSRLSEQKIAGYRNFSNKLWNIARYVLRNKVSVGPNSSPVNVQQSLTDKWILSRLNHLITVVTQHIDRFELSEAGMAIYDFTWHEFADWYVEIHKLEQNTAVLYQVFETILKLLHPFSPFITEKLWLELGRKHLLIAEWPQVDDKGTDTKAEKEFEQFQRTVQQLRSFKAHSDIKDALVVSEKKKGYNETLLSKLSGLRFSDSSKEGYTKLPLLFPISVPKEAGSTYQGWQLKEQQRLNSLIEKKNVLLKNNRIPDDIRSKTEEEKRLLEALLADHIHNT